MCEFISFDGKRNEPKKSRPYSVGLRRLCALQLRPVAAELAALRQPSLFSGLSLQCSTTQKGMKTRGKRKGKWGKEGQKPGSVPLM